MFQFIRSFFVPDPYTGIRTKLGPQRISDIISNIHSDVISRHSEDYNDPLFWAQDYPNNEIELERHLGSYDQSINQHFDLLKDLLEKGIIRPLDFLEKYEGKCFKQEKTNIDSSSMNIDAIRDCAKVNRQNYSSFEAKSVVDGHKNLLEILMKDPFFNSKKNTPE
jgi:hypothetical protein